MSEEKVRRLNQVAKEFNIGLNTIVEFLGKKGMKIESNPNTKITQQQFDLLHKEFASSKALKKEAEDLTLGKNPDTVIKTSHNKEKVKEDDEERLFVKSGANTFNASEKPKVEKKEEPEPELIKGQLPGLKVLGKVDLEKKTPQTPQQQPQQKNPQHHSVNKDQNRNSGENRPKNPANNQQNNNKVNTPQNNENRNNNNQRDNNKPQEKRNDGTFDKSKQQEQRKNPVNTQQNKNITQQQTPSQDLNKNIAPIKEQNIVQPQDKEITNVPSTVERKDEPVELIEAKADKLQGLTVLGKIDLPVKKSKQPVPVASSDDKKDKLSRRQRKRMKMMESKLVASTSNPASLQGGTNTTPKTPNTQNRNNNTNPNNRNNSNNQNNNNRSNPNPQNRNNNSGTNTNTPRTNTNNTGTNNNTPRTNTNNNAPRTNNNNTPRTNNTGGNNANRGGNNNQNRTGGQTRPYNNANNAANKPLVPKAPEEISAKDIDDQLKATLAKINSNKSSKFSQRSKYRKDKRNAVAEANEQKMLQEQENAKTLKVTEFISASELANLMDVTVNELISKAMGLGIFVSINQRLDAEMINFIADEFGYKVDFSATEEDVAAPTEEVDLEGDLVSRAPIVTIMGHVDHGKTSLLDYIRRAKVAAGEAGGITQHIGAYDVTAESGKHKGQRIVFLDTPGHEAFTAMRARGAKVTDVAIIVIATDDRVMPQTIEAINHAQVAGVPIVFALNKVDKPTSNPTKIKQELAAINIFVEEYGGKYQTEEVSAKSGKGIDELLEKVLLEAEILNLRSNPNKNASGSVIEAQLDKGRGYVSTILVQNGTLNVGDVVLCGSHFGKVRAMTNHFGKRMKSAGPSTPVQILGLDGAPQAGDKFQVMDSEREAKEIAFKRQQILREQSIRTTKRPTLKDLGRRIALGTFKTLNIIVKGDVDGSIEALAGSLLKLSTEEIEVKIIHKAVGQISESDVLLASASDAIIVGFQVRPSGSARKLAEKEEIEIRLYSIIYDAIAQVKDAMEGMLAPTIEEVILGNAEIKDVFKISKVGTVAGCMMTEGVIKRNSRVRVVRDGIVVYGGQEGGEISSLKRFKDDVNEVKQGFDCGISLRNFNDIKVGDIIEAFEQKETKRTLV